MRAPGIELIDHLGAEYVLGTLRGGARARFERWLGDPGESPGAQARRAVRGWEDRLVRLADGVPRVEPSPQVWREIERRTRATAVPAAAPRDAAAARRRPWRPWALAASLLVVAFGAWLALDPRATQPDWQLAAQLRPDATAAVQWRVDYDAAADQLRITALAPPDLPAGTVHELWALADDSAPPVSLGLLPATGDLQRALDPTQRAAFLRAGKLAVSREPTGGSPTGVPTGPVLLVAPRGPVVRG
jgi:anti-sigma-K factor RskA